VSDKSDAHETLRRRLYAEASAIGVYAPDAYKGKDLAVAQLRRRRDTPVDDPRMAFTLTETDGVLRWEPGYGFAAPARRLGFRRGPVASGRLVAPINFECLKPSEVGSFLEGFDRKLTPNCDLRTPANGLRELKNGAWSQAAVRPRKSGRLLVFIHGTFSNSENYLSELRVTPEGTRLLERIEKHYDQVLGFDHATIAVSPVLNALDLGRLFQDSAADVDVICHSRGGLVARWWLEAFDGRAKGNARALLAGSPLYGTSLAAPDKLKAGLDFLTNVAHALEATAGLAAGGFPFLTVVTGLLRVISSVTSLAAKTPVLDAALAMIPGLCAQSQISNNNELERLNQPNSRKVEYYAVRSSFQTTRPGWHFWRYFVNIGDRLKEASADLVFEGENDLVVDTASMTVLARTPEPLEIPQTRLLDFGITDSVHHTVYFRQKETMDFITKSFSIK
jgi:pimeloyl-ACP methyl ester carboxylesterase